MFHTLCVKYLRRSKMDVKQALSFYITTLICTTAALNTEYRSCNGSDVNLNFGKTEATTPSLTKWIKQLDADFNSTIIAKIQKNTYEVDHRYFGRLSFSRNNSILILKETTTKDNGVYIREVTDEENGKEPYRDRIRLFVMDPPSSLPNITKEVTEEENVRLTCHQPQNRGIPETESKFKDSQGVVQDGLTITVDSPNYRCCLEGPAVQCMKEYHFPCAVFDVEGTETETNKTDISKTHKFEGCGLCLELTLTSFLVGIFIIFFCLARREYIKCSNTKDFPKSKRKENESGENSEDNTQLMEVSGSSRSPLAENNSHGGNVRHSSSCSRAENNSHGGNVRRCKRFVVTKARLLFSFVFAVISVMFITSLCLKSEACWLPQSAYLLIGILCSVSVLIPQAVTKLLSNDGQRHVSQATNDVTSVEEANRQLLTDITNEINNMRESVETNTQMLSEMPNAIRLSSEKAKGFKHRKQVAFNLKKALMCESLNWTQEQKDTIVNVLTPDYMSSEDEDEVDEAKREVKYTVRPLNWENKRFRKIKSFLRKRYQTMLNRNPCKRDVTRTDSDITSKREMPENCPDFVKEGSSNYALDFIDHITN